MAEFLQRYATSLVYINRSLLAEQASVAVRRDANSKPLITLHGGYSGDAPGAEIVDITVECNVPDFGFEFDPGQFIFGSRRVEFDVYAGEDILRFNGQIYSDNFQHAVNSSASLSFNARGQFSKLQWENN